MNIMLVGMYGHMGREVVKLAEAGCRGARVVLGVDPGAPEGDAVCRRSFGEVTAAEIADVDCIVDFSHHSCTADLIAFSKANKLPVIVCTTGHTPEEAELVRSASDEIPVFFSANMSQGIALLVELAKKTAAAMPDAEIEIIEKHHDRKLDAPSGTALMLCDAIREVRPESYAVCGRHGNGKRTPEEIGVHAIRMGNIVGEHEVIIGTNNQTITLRHEAHDRALFAEGALAAAEFLAGRPAGLYTMRDIVTQKN